MADVTIPKANVESVGNPTLQDVTCGAAVIAGRFVYEDAASGKVNYATSLSAATAAVTGMLVNSGERDGAPATIQKDGDVAVGAILTTGELYVLADNAGKLMPASDLVTNDFVTFVGLAISTSTLRLGITQSGIQVP